MKENAGLTSRLRHAVSCRNGRSRAVFDRQRVLIGRTTRQAAGMRLRLKNEFPTLELVKCELRSDCTVICNTT
jgi:hypothetical protein